MTHVVHPYAHRLGTIRGWKSRWFATGSKYSNFLKGDILVRSYLQKRLRGHYVSLIDIERSQKTIRIIIKTSRPGMVIGRSGEGSIKIRQDVLKFMKNINVNIPEEVRIDIEEVHSPESDAAIVSQMVAEGLEKRLPFRRVLKQTVDKVMANREVRGAKISISGRLGGSEMARREEIKRGGIPLQTIRADIDFARETARLPYGGIGIKVWIYKGDVFEEKQK